MATKKTANKRVPATASKAAALLVSLGKGFIVPTAAQKKHILVALAKANKVVYGRAYDAIKIKRGKKIDLNNPYDVEKNIASIVIYEIKSTNRGLNKKFDGYFFALTAAELLVAQSLRDQFKFAFVDVTNKNVLELDLKGILKRLSGIYPTWSISF